MANTERGVRNAECGASRRSALRAPHSALLAVILQLGNLLSELVVLLDILGRGLPLHAALEGVLLRSAFHLTRAEILERAARALRIGQRIVLAAGFRRTALQHFLVRLEELLIFRLGHLGFF